MIGDKIYKFRKSRNLSQEEFANSIGVTRQIVSKWESNQSIPGVDKLKKISDVYNISYDELLNDVNYDKDKKYNIKKYIILFILMILVQIIFIFVVSLVSYKNMGSSYKCILRQTYDILEVYDSDDENYSYITLRKEDSIKTVRVSKLISSLIDEGNKYQFIFRGNENSSNIEDIFNNSEIINVIIGVDDSDLIDCK